MGRGENTIDAIINLIIAFILIYVGAVILWSLNPLFGILFILAAIYIAFSGLRKGDWF